MYHRIRQKQCQQITTTQREQSKLPHTHHHNKYRLHQPKQHTTRRPTHNQHNQHSTRKSPKIKYNQPRIQANLRSPSRRRFTRHNPNRYSRPTQPRSLQPRRPLTQTKQQHPHSPLQVRPTPTHKRQKQRPRLHHQYQHPPQHQLGPHRPKQTIIQSHKPTLSPSQRIKLTTIRQPLQQRHSTNSKHPIKQRPALLHQSLKPKDRQYQRRTQPTSSIHRPPTPTKKAPRQHTLTQQTQSTPTLNGHHHRRRQQQSRQRLEHTP